MISRDTRYENPPRYAFDFQTFTLFDSTSGSDILPKYNVSFNGTNVNNTAYFILDKIVFENYIENINVFNYIIDIGGTTYTCTRGYYSTVAALIAHINTTITASGVTLAYNAVTKLITISSGAAFNFTTVDVNYGNTLLSMLGFTGKRLSGSASYTATFPARTQYTSYINFSSNAMSLYTKLFATSKESIPTSLYKAIISGTVAGGGEDIVQYNNTQVKFKFEPTKNIQMVDIFLTDEFGNYLEPFQGKWHIDMLTYNMSNMTVHFNE